MNQAQKFLLYAFSIGALEFVPGGRQLKSGRISPYFFNSGLFNTGKGINALAEAYSNVIWHNKIDIDVLYGPPYKGIPLAVATAGHIARYYGEEIGYSFSRKEVKDHGEGGTIVGASLNGKNVVIIDDVMTTGTSSGEAVEIIRVEGGISVSCVIAFDRQEKGKESNLSAVQEFEKNYGIPVYAVATLTDLIDLLDSGLHPMSHISAEMLPKILAYQAQYGVQQTEGVQS